MTFAKLSLLLLASVTAQGEDSGTCEVRHNETLMNCWGADLRMYNRPAESWEDCCQACAEIPECKVFTWDVWNETGQRQNYCFFKSSCSDSRPSDTAISGISPRIRPTPAPTPPAPTPVPPAPTPPSENQPQCQMPEATDAMGLGDATPIRVSSKDDCCHRCKAPACAYVTFGQYQNSSDWACFLHRSKSGAHDSSPAASVASFMRRLSSGGAVKSCADLGLTSCQGAEVVIPQLPTHVPTTWLVVSGSGVFFFATSVGFGLGRLLKLGVK